MARARGTSRNARFRRKATKRRRLLRTQRPTFREPRLSGGILNQTHVESGQMRRILAELFNSSGNVNADAGKSHRAEHLYKLGSRIDPRWSVPWYNLGLLAKNNGRWEDSLTFNQRAASLSSDDQAAWWNLGIAATALHNWSIARQAWAACGIEL